MKFGILHTPDYRLERHKSSSRYYGEMMEQIQFCHEAAALEVHNM